MNLYLDIETIPSQAPDARALVSENLKPPGTLKKAESIAAWWQTEAGAALEEAYRKQSLDGGLQGEIVSIALVAEDGRDWVRCRKRSDDEADLLREAFAAVERWTVADAKALVPGHSDAFPLDEHRLVAHNAAFDIGCLWRRCVVLGLPRPRWLPGPLSRVGQAYHCTMLLWAGYGGRVSLDALCRALGIASPKDGGIDGSQVFDRWLAEDYDAIAQYNLADAWAVRQVWHQMSQLPARLRA